jgi:hypothetical protein
MIELAMRRPSRSGVLRGTLLLTGAMLAATVVASHHPLTREWALASAAVSGLGTIAVATYASRWSAFPRWSFVVAGGILAVSLVLAAALSPDLAQWRENIAINWMLPYYFLIAGLTGPVRTTGWCAPTSRWAPWLVVGVGFLLGLVNLVTSFVGAA